ncbi:MAG TPA: hypothetical protein VFF59_05605, partial [Anaerolineae bacterium]|nr:hypothetical protein [Anaerolineae bacterium]
SAVAGGVLGGVMSSASAVKAQEASRISELISERQAAWLGRVNKSAVKAFNEGGSWAVDEAAVRTLARDTANRLRRGALPDGTRAKLPRADLRSAADKLEASIEQQIEAAHNLTKVAPGPKGTVDRGTQANRGAGIWDF